MWSRTADSQGLSWRRRSLSLDLCLDANQGHGCAWEEVREGLTQHCLLRAHPPPSCLILLRSMDPHSTGGRSRQTPSWFPAPLSLTLCSEFTCSGWHLHHGLVTLTHRTSSLPYILPHSHHMEQPLDQGSVCLPRTGCPPQQGPGKCRMG